MHEMHHTTYILPFSLRTTLRSNLLRESMQVRLLGTARSRSKRLWVLLAKVVETGGFSCKTLCYAR